jgi:hypothetical protein
MSQRSRKDSVVKPIQSGYISKFSDKDMKRCKALVRHFPIIQGEMFFLQISVQFISADKPEIFIFDGSKIPVTRIMGKFS